MKFKAYYIWILLLISISTVTKAQEYFESFAGEDVFYPAYSEYYQDFDNPALSKAFLANYMEGIIVFDTHGILTPTDTLRLGTGYIKAFDYEPLGRDDDDLLVVTTSNNEVIIYNMKERMVLFQTEVDYLLNDVQFSNLNKQIVWGADKMGNLVNIDLLEKLITYEPIHKKGIARIELFMDKIITSSFDHTIQVTNQLTLEEEQKIKGQVPLLEFDVSVDGLMAIVGVRGVALYSIADKHWLYGKELLNKKARFYEDDKSKYYWNPYVNDEYDNLSATSNKVTFLRKGHALAMASALNPIQLTHARNPSFIIDPIIEDSLNSFYQTYLFNQDNHLTFHDNQIMYAQESGEDPPYSVNTKNGYIKKINDYGGFMIHGDPFEEETYYRFDFVDADYFYEGYPYNADLSLLTLDFVEHLKKESNRTTFNISKYKIDENIYFPTKELDAAEYTEAIGFSLEKAEMCIYEEEESWLVDVECLLQTAWLSAETTQILEPSEEYQRINNDFLYTNNQFEQIERMGEIVSRVLQSVDEYKNGVPPNEHVDQNTSSLSKENTTTISQELYSDNVFQRMEQKGHLSKVESFAISADQRYLASAGQDSKIIIWDFYTGIKLKELDYAAKTGLDKDWIMYETEWIYGITNLIFHPTKTWIIASTRDRVSVCWDYTTGQILGIGSNFYHGEISEDGNFLVVNNGELLKLPSLDWLDRYEGEFLADSYIIGNKGTHKNKSKNTPFVNDYIYSSIEAIFNSIQTLSGANLSDFENKAMMSPSGEWYAIDDVIFNKSLNECWNLEDYELDSYNYTPIYQNGSFSPDESHFAYIAGNALKIIDLTSMITNTIQDTTVSKFAGPVKFSPDGKYVVSRVWEIAGGELNWLEEGNTNRTLGIYDVQHLSKVRHHRGHPVEPMHIMTDSSAKYLLFKGTDFLYLLNKENLSIEQLRLKQESKRYHLSFSHAMISINEKGEPVIQGEVDKTYGNGSRYNDFEWFPAKGLFDIIGDGDLGIDFFESSSLNTFITKSRTGCFSEESKLWDMNTLIGFYPNSDSSLVTMLDTIAYKKISNNLNRGNMKLSGSFSYNNNIGEPIAIAPDYKSIFLPTNSHGIAQYEVPSMKLKRKWEAHQEHVIQLINSGNQLISISNDGDIILWDLMQGGTPKEILRFYGDKEGLFMITPDNYYSATKDNIDFVSFRKGNNFIPISSFDVKYNRPDIILERLHSSDTTLIENYHKAYEKRLKRMGIDSSQLEIEQLPSLQIENIEYLPKYTNDAILEIFVSCEQSLEGSQLWLNGVPQKVTFKAEEKRYSIVVPLVDGMNEIEIKGITNSGATLPVTYVLEKQTNHAMSNLYVLAIGTSQYADAAFNLDYAAKDAKDVGQLFKSLDTFNTFDSIHNLTLTDDEVTQESLSAIQTFLSQASINDVVIIYIAGHGLLDQNLDYYYAVYDVDFDHPEVKGWSYALFEEWLALCSANKKLLLFDTCHGGEIDKDELALNTTESTSTGEVNFRASKTFQYSEQQSNASTLSKSFFGDFRKGVGATVIASSGGTEYAAESATYQNGIFTYFLKKGLTENQADLNGDLIISVNELREYLNTSVKKATGGNQNPGTRITNDKHQIVLKQIER